MKLSLSAINTYDTCKLDQLLFQHSPEHYVYIRLIFTLLHCHGLTPHVDPGINLLNIWFRVNVRSQTIGIHHTGNHIIGNLLSANSANQFVSSYVVSDG